jgi:amidase
MRTTCGLKAWDHVPERVAEAVRRLRGAGAVIFGTTNMPALAGDGLGGVAAGGVAR